MLHGSRKRAHRLDAVHAYQHACDRSSRPIVSMSTGNRRRSGTKRAPPCAFGIDQRKHILGVDAAGLAWHEVPEFNAFFLERHHG